jgi:hypothetical protein
MMLPMTRSSPTAARYLALIVALSLSSGCAQTVSLTTTSPEAVGLAGRWTGTWRSGAISGNFALQLAQGSGDRLTATAVWYALPTVRREFTGTLADGQLILGDPKTEGLALTAQNRGVGGFSLGKLVGKGLDLVGPYALLVDGRPLAGTVDVSKDD